MNEIGPEEADQRFDMGDRCRECDWEVDVAPKMIRWRLVRRCPAHQAEVTDV